MKSNIAYVELFDDETSGYTFLVVHYKSGVNRWYDGKSIPASVINFLPDNVDAENTRVKKAVRPYVRKLLQGGYTWGEHTVYTVFPESVTA